MGFDGISTQLNVEAKGHCSTLENLFDEMTDELGLPQIIHTPQNLLHRCIFAVFRHKDKSSRRIFDYIRSVYEQSGIRLEGGYGNSTLRVRPHIGFISKDTGG
jgi:hypothetical protein